MIQQTTPLNILTRTALVAVAMLLAACGKFVVQRDLDNTVSANKNAKTEAEWENSSLHPMVLIDSWKNANTDPKDICDALLERSAVDLTLFEEQLEDPAFKAKISRCSAQVKAKIETFYVQSTASEAEALKAAAAASTRGTPTTFTPQVVYRDLSHGYYTVTADLKPKQILLTFDDGPHGQFTDSILATLEKYNVKAMFFAMGNSVKAYPEVLKRVGDAGHSVGSHSRNHACLALRTICKKNNGGHMLTFKEATGQIISGHTAVYNVLGWVDPFFRFPFGESSAELKTYLKENQMAEFYWSLDTEDWKAKTPDQLVKDVLDGLGENGRGVILMHDIQKKTAIALPRILQSLLAKGYTPVIIRAKDPNARMTSQIVAPKLASKP